MYFFLISNHSLFSLSLPLWFLILSFFLLFPRQLFFFFLTPSNFHIRKATARPLLLLVIPNRKLNIFLKYLPFFFTQANVSRFRLWKPTSLDKRTTKADFQILCCEMETPAEVVEG